MDEIGQSQCRLDRKKAGSANPDLNRCRLEVGLDDPGRIPARREAGLADPGIRRLRLASGSTNG